MDKSKLLTSNDICIVEVKNGETKSICAKDVLERLPEWFGNKQALNDYVIQVAELPFWAAMNGDGSCIGFFSVKTHYGHTGHIFVCGILPEYQHQGIGKTLYCKAEEYFIQIGCKYVIVETLSEMIEYEPYARTRSFYQSIGFKSLITLTEMWDEENPCLIMLKTLGQ